MKFSLTTIAALLQMAAKACGAETTVHSVTEGGSAQVLCSDGGQCCIGEGDVWGGLDNNGVMILGTDSSCLDSLSNGTYTGCKTTNGCDLTCSDSCEVTVVTVGDNATATAVSAANNTATTSTTASATAAVTKIDYLFPLVPGIGDTLQLLMSEMVDEFNLLNPDIEVNAIYTGNYVETMDEVVARVDAGKPPAVAVVNVNRMVELNAKDAIIPLNDYIEEAGGSVFLEQYYAQSFQTELVPGDYSVDSVYVVMGFPMMRSTPVLFYNKDALEATGLRPPTNWEGLRAAANALTTSTTKGLGLPDTWSTWIYGGFAYQAGTQVINRTDWTTVTFETDGNTEALTIWDTLAKDGSIPVPLTPWSDAVNNFVAGAFPMLYFTPGGIAKVKAGATFNWDCVYMPAGPKGFAATQGGGDFHIFQGVSKAEQDAAWKLIQFLTNPENAARYAAASGYVAVNKKSYDTEKMKAVVAETPQYLVARDQMESYGYPQMMSENIQQVREVLWTNLDDLVAGTKTVAQVQADGQAGMTAAIFGEDAPAESPPASEPVIDPPAPSPPASSPTSAASGMRVGLALMFGGIIALLK